MMGGFKVKASASSDVPAMTRRSQGLLAYLLLYRHRLHSREVLATQFWVDSTTAQARASFNTALWRVRTAIEPKGVPQGTYVVAAGRGDIGFNAASPHWLDVAEIETHVRPFLGRSAITLTATEAARMAEALDLFSGELLEGMSWEWVLQERERIRMLCLDGLTHLMQYYALHERYEEGLRCGQRILWCDPVREAVHREMMRMHCAAGQRGLAIRQYTVCRTALQDELRIDPMPATQELYEQITSDAVHELASEPVAIDHTIPFAPPLTRPSGDGTRSVEKSPSSEDYVTMQEAFSHLDLACAHLQRLGIDVEDALRLLDGRRHLRDAG
ncbi:MAG: BTAD domain-containing putative transcriptional regulator [Ardenticatenales bacterium]